MILNKIQFPIGNKALHPNCDLFLSLLWSHLVLCLNLTKKHVVLSNDTHFHPDVKVIFEVLTLVTKIYCWLDSPSSNYMNAVTIKLAFVRRGSSSILQSIFLIP